MHDLQLFLFLNGKTILFIKGKSTRGTLPATRGGYKAQLAWALDWTRPKFFGILEISLGQS
jgi:hypothetical protein